MSGSRRRVFVGIVVLVAFLNTSGGGARAQQNTAPLRDIQGAFFRASARAHAAFVVEGEPFRKVLTAQEAEPIEALKADTPVAAFVARVAEAYDYEAQAQPGGTLYVLKKRYSNPDDLPFVTLSEARAAVNAMQQVAASFYGRGENTQTLPTTTLRDFAASLTEAQLAAMQDTKRGIAVRDLSSPQYAQLSALPRSIYLRSLHDDLRLVDAQFRLVMDASATIGTATVQDTPLFGYAGPQEGVKPPRTFRALNTAKPDLPGKPVVTAINGIPVVPAAEPLSAPKTPLALDQAPAPLSQSLRDAVNQTQKRDTAAPPITLGDELADKPVWLVNASAASPSDVLRGLSAVYDVRLTTTTNGSRHLVRAPTPRPRRLTDVPNALMACLPASFGRALHWRAYRSITGNFFSAGSSEAGQYRPFQLRWASVRRLRTTIEPRLRKEAKTQVPINSLQTVEQAALADALLMDLWDAVGMRLMYPAPDYVAQFDDAIVMGGYNGTFVNDSFDPVGTFEPEKTENRNSFTVQFLFRTEAGALRQGGLMYTGYFHDRK